MSVVLGEDGRFLFPGVASEATLRFTRGDGVNAVLAVAADRGGEVIVELGRSNARRARRAVRAQLDQYEGIVTEVGESSISLEAAGKGLVTIQVDEETEIRRASRIIALTDIEPGDRVHVKATPDGEEILARVIMLQREAGEDEGEEDGARVELEGILLTVSEEEIEIDAAGRGPTLVTIDESTFIRKGNRSFTPADLEEGWRVHVKGVRDGESIRAIEIMVQNTGNGSDGGNGGGTAKVELEGPIFSVSDSEIVVDAAGKGRTTAVIDSKTQIRHGNRKLTPADLKSGDRVHVQAVKEGDTLVARKITLQRPA